MNDVAGLTGRPHELFEFTGDKDAEICIVVMSSSAENCIETVEHMNLHEGKKWAMIKVCLFRPWSMEYFMAKVPKNTKRISVLDKTREEGSTGNPLYHDVLTTVNVHAPHIKVNGGAYGIASKDFNPNSIIAIFENLEKENPKNFWTVGITDDVTHTSLEVPHYGIRTATEGTKCVINWGFGGDGSVGAMTSTARLIAERTPNNV